jgi:hypothetical protein
MSNEISDEAKVEMVKAAFKHQQHEDLKAFTKAAMQGLCSNPNSWDVSNETIVGASVNLAKATLEALEKAE